jgi:hypothetical protein
MKLDDDAKDAVKNLGDSINAAVGESKRVAEAIEWLRAIGYEPHLTLRLEIALEKTDAEDEAETTPNTKRRTMPSKKRRWS